MPKELKAALLNEARRLRREAAAIRHFVKCSCDWCQVCIDNEQALAAACERVWSDPTGLCKVLSDALEGTA